MRSRTCFYWCDPRHIWRQSPPRCLPPQIVRLRQEKKLTRGKNLHFDGFHTIRLLKKSLPQPKEKILTGQISCWTFFWPLQALLKTALFISLSYKPYSSYGNLGVHVLYNIYVQNSTNYTNVRYVETLVMVFISANRYLQGKSLFLYKISRTYKPLFHVQMYIVPQYITFSKIN